ncbi:hypothetical protein H5410_002466 [Solanum commersonii]|uniref:Uncharacterized protein n=1 Tax=Solanum commersonii TaxID=4109 RepID=A0A9J6B1U5_SOLCO|nr:hypothetical protein H5410_002466 [Solanum commersonii]
MKHQKGRKNLKKNEELLCEPTRSKALTSHSPTAIEASDDERGEQPVDIMPRIEWIAGLAREVLDYSTHLSSIPVSSQLLGKYTSTKEWSRITNDITREEDQHNHLIVDLNGEPLQLPIQPPPENNQPERRSTRGSKPPIWMNFFLYLNIHQE